MSAMTYTQAANEIARALPFAQKFQSAWWHYCTYCRYIGTTPYSGWAQSKGRTGRSIHQIKLNGQLFNSASIATQLRKILK